MSMQLNPSEISDLIKSRIQTAPPGSYPRGYADVYASVVRDGGHAGLFRGFAPAVMRAIPASTAWGIWAATPVKARITTIRITARLMPERALRPPAWMSTV